MLTCCDAQTPSDGQWAKPKKPRMSVYFLDVSVRKLRLMATGQSQKKPGCQPFAFTCFDAKTPMATGQSRKNRGCQKQSSLEVVLGSPGPGFETPFRRTFYMYITCITKLISI